MKSYVLVAILILFCCYSHAQQKNNILLIKSCKNALGLTRKLTKRGNVIDYKFLSSEQYQLQWGRKGGSLRTFYDTLYCSDPSTRNPLLIQESAKYLLMRYGCGSSCWAGIVLPLYKTARPKRIYYYVATDLKNDLIASIDITENALYPIFIIRNLRTGKVQTVPVKRGCIAASPHYCLDSATIKNKIFYYKWSAKMDVNKSNPFKRIRIRI